MKRFISLLAAAWLFTGCSLLTGINWDHERIASATGKAVAAMSISDEQIVELCRQSVAQLDQQNTIDNGAYIARLNRLMASVGQLNGLKLNYKVYRTDQVNAFASGDGSVRVFSGLMDLMDDGELMSVIGHEIGHVVHQDTKNALKKAYMASAASDLVGAAGTVGAVTQGLAGGIAGGDGILPLQHGQVPRETQDPLRGRAGLEGGPDVLLPPRQREARGKGARHGRELHEKAINT